MQPRFFCECVRVKPSCKSIVTTKEALLRFTIVSFSGKFIFNGVLGHSYTGIKIAIFETLRRLDTTWNFAHSITIFETVDLVLSNVPLVCRDWHPLLWCTILTKMKINGVAEVAFNLLSFDVLIVTPLLELWLISQLQTYYLLMIPSFNYSVTHTDTF